MTVKRVLIKVSGEYLSNGQDSFNYDAMLLIINNIKNAISNGYEICLLVGGGNIFRGNFISKFFDHSNSNLNNHFDNASEFDYIGMSATLTNALMLNSILKKHNIPSKVFSPIGYEGLCSRYEIHSAREYIKKGICIFGGGLGCPSITTDTASVIRANEMQCDMALKATQVGGLYNKDPIKYPDARYIKQISYQEYIKNNFSVMDLQSIVIAMQLKMNISIFKIEDENSFLNTIQDNNCNSKIK